MKVWDDRPGSGSTDEKRGSEMKTASVTRAGLSIVAGLWMPSLSVLTIPMLSYPGHLHSIEELLFVCTRPVTPQTHSLRAHPGQGSSYNSGHLLLLSIAKLFGISRFLNLFSIDCSAPVHSKAEGCHNTPSVSFLILMFQL